MELEELQRLRMSLDIQAKMVRTTVKTHSDRFTTPEKTLCFRYLQPDVTSWWEDIITESAVSQNKPIPIFPDPKPEDYWDFGKAGDGGLGAFIGGLFLFPVIVTNGVENLLLNGLDINSPW